jgi:O-antigen ligase
MDFRPGLATSQWIGTALITFGTFLSGFVIAEPAPYELYMALIIGPWFILGLKLSRTTGALTALMLVYMTGGFLSLTQMHVLSGAPMYMAVSLFLAVTSVFYAAIIEQSPARLHMIFKAWVAAAVITALLGILGYFHAFPGAEIFTRYDRAMGAFQDPNVFGPFLIAPSLYLIHAILTGRIAQLPLRAGALMIIAFGILLSFSRAAWALFVFSAAAFVLLMVIKERSGAFRLKVVVIALAGLLVMVAALAIALQFDSVTEMFSNRTRLVQDYDGARLGRFERHRIGFLMSMEHPLGIGPMVFSTIFPEDEHNIWLKNLTSYGWLGFLAYLAMLWTSLGLGLKYMFRSRPWQPFLMVAWVVLAGHAIIGNVIDTDHWRHHYILFGVIWGCLALEHRLQAGRRIPGMAA